MKKSIRKLITLILCVSLLIPANGKINTHSKRGCKKSADRIKQYMTKGSAGINILQNPEFLPER